MFSLASLILISVILIFLIIFKRRLISKFINKNKTRLHNKSNEKSQTRIYTSTLKNNFPITKDIKVYSNNERIFLKRKMKELFKGSKEDKIKALKIAKQLSDKSTLQILRMGLRDTDSEIVEIAASLIENFK